MSERRNVSSGSRFEKQIGYSRAVRIGNIVSVAGTGAFDEKGEIVGKGDSCMQTSYIIKKIEKALIQVGASLDDVVTTRLYTTDISKWEGIARAHQELFGKVGPTTTMVEISKFIVPEMLVEVEAQAVIREQTK